MEENMSTLKNSSASLAVRSGIRSDVNVVGRRDLLMVNPLGITLDPSYNVRDLNTPDAKMGLEELANSIKENGIKVPLKVRRGGDHSIVLVQGHRRLSAVKSLIEAGEEIKSVPCVIEEKHQSETDRILDLILSNSGAPLTVLEKGEVVKRLLAHGWTNQDVAKRLGVSIATVYNWMMLVDSPEELKAEVRAGTLKASSAISMIREVGATATLAEVRDVKSLDDAALKAKGKRAGTKVSGAQLSKRARSRVGKTSNGNGSNGHAPDGVIPCVITKPVRVPTILKLSKAQTVKVMRVLEYVAEHDTNLLTIEQARGIVDEVNVLLEALAT